MKNDPKKCLLPKNKTFGETLTLFAQKSPQALQSDLGPDGPRRIIGVDFELVPQCVHLYKWAISIKGKHLIRDLPVRHLVVCIELLSI